MVRSPSGLHYSIGGIVKNWLGQDIEVDSIVYRGARSGNTSEYKVGIVTKINEATRKVTVRWLLEKRYSSGKPWAKSGTSDIDTMVLIDLDYQQVIDKCEEFLHKNNMEIVKRAKERGMQLTFQDPWW